MKSSETEEQLVSKVTRNSREAVESNGCRHSMMKLV